MMLDGLSADLALSDRLPAFVRVVLVHLVLVGAMTGRTGHGNLPVARLDGLGGRSKHGTPSG